MTNKGVKLIVKKLLKTAKGKIYMVYQGTITNIIVIYYKGE